MGSGLEYGFYNSKADSIRTYDANQFGRMFDGVIAEPGGVFPTIGDKFKLTATQGMRFTVGSGRAWLHHTWNYLETSLEYKLEAGSQFERYDAVVLQVGCSDILRENKIYVKKGVPTATGAKPQELERTTDTIYEYILGYIHVPAEATEISQENITNLVGVDEDTFYDPDMLTPFASVISNNYINNTTITLKTPEHGDTYTEANNNGKYYWIEKDIFMQDDAIYTLDVIPDPNIDVSTTKAQLTAFSSIFNSKYADGKIKIFLFDTPSVDINIRVIGKSVNTLLV